MRAKIGDVVIDRSYRKSGRLAVVVGEGISQPILIHHSQGITMDRLGDYFSTWDGLEVIGYIDFEKVWAEAVRIADRKTEPQTDCADTNLSEKPTDSTRSKMEQVDKEYPRCVINGTPFDECGFCEHFNCDTCQCEAQTERSE